MSLKIASWRAPGSILEAPGLDFGASGSRFGLILESSGIDFSVEGWQENVSYPPWGDTLKAWQSPHVLAHKWGGGGGPPWGEFNGIGAKLGILVTKNFARRIFNYADYMSFDTKCNN